MVSNCETLFYAHGKHKLTVCFIIVAKSTLHYGQSESKLQPCNIVLISFVFVGENLQKKFLILTILIIMLVKLQYNFFSRA